MKEEIKCFVLMYWSAAVPAVPFLGSEQIVATLEKEIKATV